MARGDQVYVYRDVMGVPYEHHGIDCGDGTVIHYSKRGEAAISRTSRAAFAQGKTIYTKSQPTSFIADIVVERAESRLGERQYDLFFNNCEHFANWCKVGRSECYQLSDFGLRFDQIRLPQVDELGRSAAQTEPPEKTWQLFQAALENVAMATRTLLPQYKSALKETLSWDQVAQKALKKDRKDLARAALYKKVAAKKEAVKIKTQLTQLSDLQLSLEQNQALVPSPTM
ncbi:MAG: lecithin retinol acyltransferase family protein [Cyanobacteria bacterium P01_D01_bin.36]